MKMYKCPTCGKTYTSMYCDYCSKSIPGSSTTYGSMDGDNTLSGSDATNEILNRIAKCEETNNQLLKKIERHTWYVAWVIFATALISLLFDIYVYFFVY